MPFFERVTYRYGHRIEIVPIPAPSIICYVLLTDLCSDASPAFSEVIMGDNVILIMIDIFKLEKMPIVMTPHMPLC